MHAIVSILNQPENEKVIKLWKRLEYSCSLMGIKLTPIPHFSWIVFESSQGENIKQILTGFAQTQKPLIIKTNGLGIFPGQDPVLFLALQKSKTLLEYQETIFNECKPYLEDINLFYYPDFWVPHITLAKRDLTLNKLSCAIRELLEESILIDVLVDNLALVYQIDEQIGKLDKRYNFMKIDEQKN